LLSVIRDIWCGPALLYAEDVIDELRRESADVVATCEGLFGVMAGCESIGQKFVNLCPNISLAPLPGVPPLGPGLAPARNEEERLLHAQIAEASVGMFDSGLPALNAARLSLGLPPIAHVLDQFRAADLELLATSRAFDFPSEGLPARVRYVGPQLADPQWAKTWNSPWAPSDKRPLIAVGFSTTFQNHAQVLQNVIDAFAGMEVRVLITLGGSIKQDELRPASNCVLVESAPHSVVMRQAALVVTHGGHGTIIRALMSRKPILVIPHGRDQNDNAVRVTERGAGLSLLLDASIESIRAAGERLLREPSFREAAIRLGDLVIADAENSTIVQELESIARQNQDNSKTVKPSSATQGSKTHRIRESSLVC
jgi:UDP:flavonoid glycosyltransferase YjiC (YdhE family)